MNDNEPITVDLSWPGGMVTLSFLVGPTFGATDEYPVRVTSVSGAFHGRATLDVIGLPSFVEELTRLHETMRGEASLFGWDERHPMLRIFARQPGQVGVEVRLASDQFADPNEILSVRGYVDQSYLPRWLAGFRKAAKAECQIATATEVRRRTLVPQGLLQWTAAATLTVVPVGILFAELFKPEPDALFLVRGVSGLVLLAMLAAIGERELRAGR